MNDAAEKTPHRRQSAWFIVIALAAAWPIANLLHNNWSMLIASDLERATMWWLAIFAFIVLSVLVTGRLWRGITVVQLSLAASAGVLLLFLFHFVVTRLAHALAGIGLPSRTAIAVYPLLALAIVVIVLRAAQHRRPRLILTTFLIVGSGTAIGLLTVDVARTGFHGSQSVRTLPLVDSRIPTTRPNVFLMVLDGYSRQDVLLRIARFDNAPMLEALRARGFVVLERAVANYPVTYLSVSSLLATDYVATTDNPPFTTRAEFYDIIQGNNPIVASFQAMGYSYIHSGNAWGGSACSGREDLCLNRGELGVPSREIDLNIVLMTPFRLLLPELVNSSERGNLPSLMRSLDLLYQHTPFFLFSHSMPPHPPFEWAADCSRKKVLPTLKYWSSPAEYRENVECVNRQLIQLVDQIVARDADAMQILLSDHGSSFTEPFNRPLDKWSDEMIAERFPSFIAIRAPESCRASLRDNLSNVNVGRYVVSCVSGTTPQYLADRFFTSGVEWHPSFGQVHEVTSRVQALQLR